jgi:hypothetical protein
MKRTVPAILLACVLTVASARVFADGSLLNLGPEELVQAGGVDVDVGTYSVPSFDYWDGDDRKDLIVGAGNGKVRIYLNVGTESDPQFSDYFYAQSNGSDLYCPPSGCLGCFPRIVYWDGDDRKDLLVGLADGTVKIFVNTGTEENPAFDGGTNVRVGDPGIWNLDVGTRATTTFVDWNSDGMMDLVVGALDGKIHIYLDCGCTWPIPAFHYSPIVGDLAEQDGWDLIVPSSRSSPVVFDLDGDGKKDLLTGNTNGQLLFYGNVGTDVEPSFSGYSFVESNGMPIDLPGSPRSRPFVCYWTEDGYPDVLIGAGDGKVHLYQGIPTPGDMDVDGDVDFADLGAFAACWNGADGAQCEAADLTGDGQVNAHDLGQLAANWLTGCE